VGPTAATTTKKGQEGTKRSGKVEIYNFKN
jgi:hypothetical protein